MQIATTLITIILAAVTLASGTASTPKLAFVGEEAVVATAFTYTGFSQAHHEIVDWALALFVEADLELPSIDFIASSDLEPCNGRTGAARHGAKGSEITICGAEVLVGHDIVVVHELAHAWEKHNSTPEARAAFLELRGLTEWRSGDWHDRGAEHAASIIAWGLIDRPTIPGHIDFDGCDDLIESYRTIVGADPLHGFRDHCDS